jgi:serine/threonine protein kinase/dipeptidyl aminopeptidase/acylaminoacyl peptidase
MTPERWRDIERLYHAALERDGDQRAAFLAETCADDPALRREVESLLAYRARTSDFLETPAADAYPGLAAIVSPDRSQLQPPPPPGRFVGHLFGVYEIQALIATGGMGEIYRGLDTRLHRTVAIKTLPAHMSHDPAWRARFNREAQAVSRLNHPHICTLYDVGIENDVQYLVMEHMEGETLAARLARGPLPLAASLQYSIEIAEALDEAHRMGVVHRDLKPSNVMLTKSGVKVLDFGLATEMRSGVLDGSLAEAAPALTATGVILGTPQYMAPEQIEGRPLDARTDIFSFGAMAYEMLTGARAFRGDTPIRLVSAILKDDPRPIAEFAPDVPWLLARTIARCMAKAPEDRWQTAADLLFQLRTIGAAPEPIDAPPSRPVRRWRSVERGVWAAVLIASIAGTWLWARRQGVPASVPRQDAATVRFAIAPPAGTTFASSQDVPLTLSPDGRSLVFVAAGTDGIRRLWRRALDAESDRASVLSGTEGAHTPFWSPDSQWVGFFAGNSLKKLRVSTGIAQTVASAVSTFGGASWSTTDVILFPATTGGLARVSAQGGPVSQVTNGQGHFWPQFLPDGEHYLYAAGAPSRVMVGALGNEAPRTLMTFPVRGSALAYAAGHVFFVQDRELFARPFDPVRLEFSGAPTRVLQGIPVVGNGRAPFAVSAAGVLAYWPQPLGESAVLQWFDRTGRSTAAVASPARYLGFALASDAKQLVVSRMDANGGADLWLLDVDRGRETQLTFDAASFTPQFSPDDSALLFTGPGPAPPPKMFVRAVTGAGTVSRVGSAGMLADFASSWIGDSVVSVRIDPVNRNDLWLHRMSDGSDTRLSVNTAFNESHGKVSPDGRWLAYVTDQSGRDEVWIAAFPSGEPRRQVSTTGGTAPEWGDGSKELFYLSPDRHVMAASISGHGGVETTAPHALFQMPTLIAEGHVVMPTAANYVATRDGRRFLAAVSAADPKAPPLNVVVNWPAALSREGKSQ